MADTQLGRNAALLYAFNQIGENLSKYALWTKEKHKEELTAKLGAEFVNQVQSAKNTEELMDVLLKGNKISSMLKVPELATQLNNLGNLKQMQLSEAKTKLTEEQKAEISAKNYSNIPVLYEGKMTSFGETPEYQKIMQMPPALRPEMFESAFKTYQTQTTAELVPGKKGYELKIFGASDKYPEYKLVQHYVQGEDKTYDDLVTEALEKEQKPKEIVAQEFKDWETEQAIRKQIRISNATKDNTHVTFINDANTGEPVALVYTDPDPVTKKIKMFINNEEVTDLSGYSKYKVGMGENPYENLFSFTKGLKNVQYETNLSKYPYMKAAIQQTINNNDDAKEKHKEYMETRKSQGKFDEPPVEEEYNVIKNYVPTTINDLKENDVTKTAGNDLETLRNKYIEMKGYAETYEINYLLGRPYWHPSMEEEITPPKSEGEKSDSVKTLSFFNKDSSIVND